MLLKQTKSIFRGIYYIAVVVVVVVVVVVIDESLYMI